MPAANHIITNNRLLASDSVFTHRDVLEVGRQIPPHLRFRGRLTARVFNRLYGELGDLECANTGLPANASERMEHRHARRKRKLARPADERVPFQTPDVWNHVENSWCNYGLMQQHSAVWQGYRERFRDSPGVETLSRLVTYDPRQVIEHYDPRLSSMGNWMVLQLASLMNHTAGPVAGLPTPMSR
jgi:hypothetical protein